MRLLPALLATAAFAPPEPAEHGSGMGEGQFIESSCITWDKQGNMYVGDTTVGRSKVSSLQLGSCPA